MPEPVSTAKELMALSFILPTMALSALICRFLRISPFLGYLITGIISQAFLEQCLSFAILSKIGIVLLFFHIGTVVTWKGVILSRNLVLIALDFGLNFMVPFVILIMLRYTTLEAIVISTILYPTSSVVTISNLIQQKRSGYPETEVIVWMMIGEDIIIIILMVSMMQFGINSTTSNFWSSIIFMFVIIALYVLLSKYIGNLYLRIPKENRAILLFSFAFLSGILAYKFGFSEALGAFLFGMLFSGVREMEEAERQLGFLRELGVAFFFLLFGLKASLTFNPQTATLASVVLAFAAGSKWLTGIIGGKLTGLGKRAQKRLAFSLWTRGEFSMLFLWMFSNILSTLWIETLSLFIIFNVFFGLLGFFLSRKQL